MGSPKVLRTSWQGSWTVNLTLRSLFQSDAVVEAVAFVSEPDADGHRQAEFVRLVEDLPSTFEVPGADRIAASLGELLERMITARAPDEEGLAATEQLPAGFGLAQLDGNRLCVRDTWQQRQPSEQ